jgi:hypothetical protein
MHTRLTLHRRTGWSLDATAGDGSTLDITALSVESEKEEERWSPPFGKKLPAASAGQPAHVDVVNPELDCTMPGRTCSADARLYNPNVTSAVTSSTHRSTVEALPHQRQSPLPHRSAPKAQFGQRQPGPIEL